MSDHFSQIYPFFAWIWLASELFKKYVEKCNCYVGGNYGQKTDSFIGKEILPFILGRLFYYSSN